MSEEGSGGGVVDVGGIVARLGLDTTPLRRGRVIAEEELAKTDGALLKTGSAALRVERSFGRLGTASKVVGGIIGFELARKAGEGLKVAVEYASDLEQTMRRVRNVFGESTGEVVEFAEGTDKTLGRTKDQALQTSVRFGTLATQFGASREEAAKMSVTLTKLSSDLAASKGTEPEEATQALVNGLVGRGRALRIYGMYLDTASIKQEALKEGLISTTKDALDPAARFQASYNLILRQSANATGFFGKNLDTVKEKQQVTAATMKDAGEALGNAIIPAEKAFARVLADDVAPALKHFGEGLGFIADHKLTRDVVVGIGGVATGLFVLHKAVHAVEGIGNLWKKLTNAAGHAENAAAIKAEGNAAAVTTAELRALAEAEVLSGRAAAVGAAERGAGLSAAEIAALRGKPGILGRAGGSLGLAAGGLAGSAALPFAIGGAALYSGYRTFLGGDPNKNINAQIDSETDVKAAQARINELKKKADAAEHGREHHGLLTEIGGDLGLITSAYDAADNAQLALERAVKKLEDLRAVTKYHLLHLTPVERAQANVTVARQNLSQARKTAEDPTVQAGEAQLVGGVFGGAFDELPKLTKGDPSKAAEKVASAQSKVASAQDSIAAAGRRVAEATARLATLRSRGTATTLQMSSAEHALANAHTALTRAQERAGRAQAGVTKSRKAEADAAGSTALTVKDVTARLTGQVGRARGLAGASNQLIREGVSQPVLEELDRLEQSAPGTLQRVAATLTPAMARKLNSQYGALQKAQHDFLTAPLRAATAQAKTEAEQQMRGLAAAQAAAYAAALRDLQGERLMFPFEHGLPASPASAPGVRPAAGAAPGSRTTIYSLPGAIIQAPDPAALARELAARARVSALAGQGVHTESP